MKNGSTIWYIIYIWSFNICWLRVCIYRVLYAFGRENDIIQMLGKRISSPSKCKQKRPWTTDMMMPLFLAKFYTPMQ